MIKYALVLVSFCLASSAWANFNEHQTSYSHFKASSEAAIVQQAEGKIDAILNESDREVRSKAEQYRCNSRASNIQIGDLEVTKVYVNGNTGLQPAYKGRLKYTFTKCDGIF